MKKLLLALILTACGDNLHALPDATVPVPEGNPPEIAPSDPVLVDAGIPTPDARVSNCPPSPVDHDLDEDDVCPVPVDAGIDAPPQCDDKHIDLNDHEHKCTHDQ